MAPVQVLMLGYIANARKLTKTTNYDKLKAYTYIDLQFIREKLVKKNKTLCKIQKSSMFNFYSQYDFII